MINNYSRLCGLCTLATLYIEPAYAQSERAAKDWSITIGAGVAAQTNIYKGEDNEVSAFPYLSATWKRLSLSIDGLEYNVYENDDFQASLNLSIRDPDFPDTPLFSGLNRNTAIEAGFNTRLNLAGLYTDFSFAADVSSEHDGYELGFDVGKEFEVGSFGIDFSLGVNYQDKKLSQYLYGVSSSEATAARAQYSPGDVFIPHVELSIARPLSESLVLGAFASYELLPSEISDSSLTKNEDGITSAGIFLLKTF